MFHISSVRIYQYVTYIPLSITQGFVLFFQKYLLCQRRPDDLTVRLEGKCFLH